LPEGHEELTAGTNPNSASDAFRILELERSGAPGEPFSVTWSSVSGRYYSVYSSTNLMLPWHPVIDPPFSNMPGTGATLTYSNSPPHDVARYFLIEVR
jgi:hypothetical protein